jgi:hypothetical protein
MKTVKELMAFVKDTILWSLTGGIVYQLFLCLLAAMMMLGVYGYIVQFNLGLSATNMSDIVSWGFYISNFTFLVGVAAAAVMIILPSYIFKDKDLHKVVIIGEVVAIGAMVMCLMFVFVDLGGPLQAWHMIPVSGLFNWPTSLLTWDVLVLNGLSGLEPDSTGLYPLLSLPPPRTQCKNLPALCFSLNFLGIWIEKGIGLIVLGLVPSPMGEVVDYAPSWVEVCVTLGISVVTMLIKPALKIEQRFESHNRSETG